MARGFSRQRITPCKAYGHTERYINKDGSVGCCKPCNRLRMLVKQGMRYWFARLILELKALEAGLFATGQSMVVHEVYRNRYRRKKYARLRAAGLSRTEAMGKLNGEDPKMIRERDKGIKKAYFKKWGGCPKIGTEAWVRREQHNLAQKMKA